MRPLAALSIPLIALSLVACGGGDRAKKTKAETVELADITATGDSGIKVTARATKERSKALYITLNIVNTGDKTVLFRNPESERVSGFKIAADGRDAQGADAGKMQATKSPASRLHDLAPGGETDFDVKWTFDPALPHETYPWTLTITNLFVNDQKVGDVTLSYAPGGK